MIYSSEKAVPLYVPEPFCFFDGTLVEKNKLYHGNKASELFDWKFKHEQPLKWLPNIEGMFHYIWKDEGDRIFFGSDRYGLKPLFYRFDDRLEIFIDPWKQRDQLKLNEFSMCTLLAGSITLGESTAYRGVFECLPGTLYCFDRLKRELTSHVWSANDIQYSEDALPVTSPFTHLLPQLADHEAVYQLALTAGLDSRLVLADALRKGLGLETFTYGLKDEPDMLTAQSLSSKAGILHRNYSFDSVSAKTGFSKSRIKRLVECGFQGRNVPQESGWIASNHLEKGNRVVVTGHGGNWIAGNAITNEVLEHNSPEKLSDYFTWKLFYNTAHSSKDFTALIEELVRKSLLETRGESVPAVAERWSLENPKRKFHTGPNYAGNGFPVFFPFYQSKVVEPFLCLKVAERYKQRAYTRASLEFLQTTPQGLAQIPVNGKLLGSDEEKIQKHVKAGKMIARRKTDPHNMFRKMLIPSEFAWREPYSYFGTGGFTRFMKSRVDELFPDLAAAEDFLRDQRCKMSADHLGWVRKQRVSQMSPNGIMCCAFLPAMLGIE